MVVRDLAKVEARVRFPHPAPSFSVRQRAHVERSHPRNSFAGTALNAHELRKGMGVFSAVAQDSPNNCADLRRASGGHLHQELVAKFRRSGGFVGLPVVSEK